MQLNSVTESYLRREEEMLQTIINLQDQLNRAPKTIPPPESAQAGPTKFEAIQEGQDPGAEEEEDPLKERMMDTNAYLMLEYQLTI